MVARVDAGVTPEPICDDCVVDKSEQRDRFRWRGRGCYGCPVSLLTPRLRALNARMTQAGLESASAPADRREGFDLVSE